MRIRLALTAVAALLVAAPAAGAQSLPDLTRQVRVAAGPGAGYVRVHLPKPVAAHGEKAYDGRIRLRMRGGSEMRGLLLRAEHPGGAGWPDTQPPQLGFSTAGEQDVDEVVGAGLPTLPAGDYRLYVYAHGAPMTVDLDLPDLAGTSSLALTDGVRMSGGPLESRSTSADRAAIGRRLDLGPGDITAIVARSYRFAEGQSGFIDSCDETYSDPCPADDGAVPAGRPSSGTGGSVGSIGLTGPVRADFGISGSSSSGPPPALTGYARAVEFDVPQALAPQPPLADVPVEEAPAPVPASVPPPTATALTAVDTVATVVRRAARVGLTCASSDPCAGTVRLTTGSPVRFRIGAGGRKHVRLPLSRSQRRTLARRGRLRVTIVIHVPGRPGMRRRVLIRA